MSSHDDLMRHDCIGEFDIEMEWDYNTSLANDIFHGTGFWEEAENRGHNDFADSCIAAAADKCYSSDDDDSSPKIESKSGDQIEALIKGLTGEPLPVMGDDSSIDSANFVIETNNYDHDDMMLLDLSSRYSQCCVTSIPPCRDENDNYHLDHGRLGTNFQNQQQLIDCDTSGYCSSSSDTSGRNMRNKQESNSYRPELEDRRTLLELHTFNKQAQQNRDKHNSSSGNKNLARLIKAYQPLYDCANRNEKYQILREIYTRSKATGGRFLDKCRRHKPYLLSTAATAKEPPEAKMADQWQRNQKHEPTLLEQGEDEQEWYEVSEKYALLKIRQWIHAARKNHKGGRPGDYLQQADRKSVISFQSARHYYAHRSKLGEIQPNHHGTIGKRPLAQIPPNTTKRDYLKETILLSKSKKQPYQYSSLAMSTVAHRTSMLHETAAASSYTR